jgi:hypothetical protein
MSYISQYYYNWKQLETAKKQVLEISGLEINLTGNKKIFSFLFFERNYLFYFKGQLGKRTRYQINNTSQLLLDITRKESQQIIINNEEIPILPKVNKN